MYSYINQKMMPFPSPLCIQRVELGCLNILLAKTYFCLKGWGGELLSHFYLHFVGKRMKLEFKNEITTIHFLCK